MRRIFILLGLLWSVTSFAQIEDPVKWSFSFQETNEKEGNVVIKATIDRGWHVYSQFIDEGGPIPTSFKFNPSPDYTLVGKISESPKATSAFDPNFNMKISWHENQVTFTQAVKLKRPETSIKGMLEFMVCNDKQCLPPAEVEFNIPVATSGSTALTTSSAAPPANQKVPAITPSLPSTNDTVATLSNTAQRDTNTSTATISTVSSTQKSEEKPDESYWGIFVAGFFGGLAAFFMPCIYPMIPLTVSFFTKKAGSRAKGIQSAILYGVSIILIYVALGLLVTFIFGAAALNEAASSATFNLLFFIVLVIFAISFLGAFDINLPSSLVNKMDEKSNKGGLSGMFFMAFTLSLVSFSCTGPIIGTLLVDAVTKGTYLGPAFGMLGFSSALAIPFTLFAIFPSWLKEMPKSGGWLNAVKVSLGFLELALAFKFLSNVDLAYHWGILNREIFLVIWIVIFGLLSFYLLGKLKLSHDPDLKHLSLPRLFFAMFALGFTIFMIPGLWGAPLKELSAWIPPKTAQSFNFGQNNLSQEGKKDKKYGSLFHNDLGIDAYFDYAEGLAYAKQVNKPVLIDITGHSCANCRKMESSVWSDPQVLNKLKNDYVLISLYVDDKTELQDNEKYISNFSGKKIKTLGQKWSDFQASTFGTNSQPYYVIVDTEGKKLINPQAFNLDIKNYLNFLTEGKEAFNK